MSCLYHNLMQISLGEKCSFRCLKCNAMPLGGSYTPANYSMNSTKLGYMAEESDLGILTGPACWSYWYFIKGKQLSAVQGTLLHKQQQRGHEIEQRSMQVIFWGCNVPSRQLPSAAGRFTLLVLAFQLTPFEDFGKLMLESNPSSAHPETIFPTVFPHSCGMM